MAPSGELHCTNEDGQNHGITKIGTYIYDVYTILAKIWLPLPMPICVHISLNLPPLRIVDVHKIKKVGIHENWITNADHDEINLDKHIVNCLQYNNN